MANAVNTGSTTSWDNTKNKTSTSISTNIRILVGGNVIGAIQKLNIDEKREIKQVDEVGTDGHIDSLPHTSSKFSGSCERIRFDRLRITEAFGRGFVHVSSQAYPFDIVIIDKQKTNSASWITTTLKNVWINSLTYAYQASDWIITDSMGWEAESISSVIGTANPVAQGGERGSPYSVIPGGGFTNIEQLADMGKNGRMGSLDVSGLIDIGGNGSGSGGGDNIF